MTHLTPFRPLLLLALLLLASLPLQARELIHNATGKIVEGIGTDFTLTGPGGRPVTLSDFHGKLVLLYFGYTSCPDICPTSLGILQRSMRSLGEEAKEVQGIFVTVDPKRDGGEKLQTYVHYFHPTFIGLEGSEEAIARAARPWGVMYKKEESDSAAGYLIAHTDDIFLLDRNGELAALFNSQSRSAEVTAAIRTLLNEEPEGLLAPLKKLFQ